MHPVGRGAQAALLKWVNTLPLDRKVEKIEDLADGHVFAQMLQDLDPDYNPSELEHNLGSSTWLTKKRNIQSVFKALTKFIIHKDTSGQIDFLPRTVDFRAISDNLDNEGISQLLSVFAAAAMLGEQSAKYIPTMLRTLSKDEQGEIMKLLQDKQEEREKLTANGAEDSGEANRALDPGLAVEAELATLSAEHDRLNKKLADSNTRFEHLQISYERLKDELERTQNELEEEKHKHGADESQIIHDLYEKHREQDDLIRNQEGQIEQDRQSKERLTAENLQMSKKLEHHETLQDQAKELKHANEELTKKANAAERYKQKLEQNRLLETELQNAQYELSQNRETLREYENLQDRCTQQLTTIERLRTLVATNEQELDDSRRMRAALEEDIRIVQSKLDRLREQKALDDTRIIELEQQILHGAAPSSESPGASQTAFNLEQELQHTADPTAAYNLEISRLRAENNLLRNNMGVASENDRLRADLEDWQNREKLAQAKYSDMLEKHVVAQEQIQALLDNMTGEGSRAFADLKKSLVESNFELTKQNGKVQELEGHVADRDRELLSLKTDLSAVEKGSVNALEELKSTDQLISASLKNELDALRKRHKSLELEFEQQKTQLIDALVSKDKLRRELDESSKELPAISSPKVDESAASGIDQAAIDEIVCKSNEKIGKLRARIKQQKEQLEKADQERYDLQRRLKAAEQGGTFAAQKAANDQIIKTLQRENAMISTAWYDLTSRLQSNHVVLQRRQDMPKSWLNKQRQMVNATPRR